MCTAYWNLNATVNCPECDEPSVGPLQTHWRGDDGSMLNYYNLGEVVPELEGHTGRASEEGEDMCGSCPNGHYFDVDAVAVNGCILEVGPLPKPPS